MGFQLPTLLALAALPFQAQGGLSRPGAGSEPRDDAARRGAAESPARARLLESHAKMVALLAELARKADVDDRFVGTGNLPAMRATLKQMPPGKRPKNRWDLLCNIGTNELRLGNTRAAVDSFAEAVSLIPRLAGQVDEETQRAARFQLAMSWLRLGETQNCVAQHTSESCILPIGKKGVHVEQEGSRKAIEILTALLQEKADDSMAIWLLNLATMTVGEWPDGVPEAYRIPPSTFASDEDFPRFVDVAPELGLNSMTLAGGAITDDFDGDDVLDILVSDMSPRGQMQLFQGHRDGTFGERTSEAGLLGIVGGLYIVQTDYDNDGWLDVFVPRGAWKFELGTFPCSLLHNNGDGTFTDVTFAAGLGEPYYPSQVGAWADYDNDGDLDLFKGNESTERIKAPSQLFRNNGDGTFVDVAEKAGVRNERFCKGATWGDYDGDRFPDLYVSNLGEANRLYRNKGDGTFQDVAVELGMVAPYHSFAAWWWDYDNDGVLDLYVTSYRAGLGAFVKTLLGGEAGLEIARLYRGTGDGLFSDVAREVGLDEITVTMGSNFGDVDSDGYLDFYLGTGFPEYEGLIPNKMFWNRVGKRFSDVTTAAGLGHLQKGHAVAIADLDRDGDQDIFEEMGGAFLGDPFGNALFRNPGFGNHSVTLKLAGVKSNRAAIGARIRCEITEGGARRSVYRHVNSGGSFGANPLRQAIGLGKATKVDVLEVYWPTTDRTQTFRDVAADATYAITEDSEQLVRIE